MANRRRVVIVTGGSGALGQAITRRFLTDGHVVCVPWIVDRERERLEGSVDAATRPRLLLERCDVGDDAAMERLVARPRQNHRARHAAVGARGALPRRGLAAKRPTASGSRAAAAH